jgi:hypothetical protein
MPEYLLSMLLAKLRRSFLGSLKIFLVLPFVSAAETPIPAH